MPVSETWDEHARLMEWHHCPMCGGPDWVHIVGHGFWCDDCNCHAITREARCDSAHIIEFDGEHCWAEAENVPPNDTAMVKYCTTERTDWPEWWAYAGEHDDDTPDWSPLDPVETAAPADD